MAATADARHRGGHATRAVFAEDASPPASTRGRAKQIGTVVPPDHRPRAASSPPPPGSRITEQLPPSHDRDVGPSTLGDDSPEIHYWAERGSSRLRKRTTPGQVLSNTDAGKELAAARAGSAQTKSHKLNKLSHNGRGK